MSARDESRSLPRRLSALSDAVSLSEDRLPAAEVSAARGVADRATKRWHLAPEATVVALAGSTGSGKSSLLNALARADVAPVGVRRPTTSATLAVVDSGDTGDAAHDVALDDLLAWLEVHASVSGSLDATDPNAARDGAALVVMDLPDTDSVREAHRLQVDRLVTQVDLLVWVVDPQKYADAVLHERYLRPLRHAADVTVVVLNQVDTLTAAAREACLQDLRRLLREDGLDGVTVLCTSAATGEGVEALRTRLVEAAATHEVAARRLSGEVDEAAGRLYAAATTPEDVPGDGRGGTHVARRRRRDLVTAMERAAGVPIVVDAVERAVVSRAVARVGWPPVRWLRHLRPDPLRRLRVEQGGKRPRGEDARLVRTSLPAPTAAARSAVDNAVRALVDDLGHTLPLPWVEAVRGRLDGDRDARADALDSAVASTDLGAERPVAATGVLGLLQWLVTLAAVAGLVWLVALAVMAWLRLPSLATPSVDLAPGPRTVDLALPTLLLLGGVAAGLVLAAIGRVIAGLAARRRARRAHKRLSDAVSEVARQQVLAPLDEELNRHAQLLDRLRQAQRAGSRGKA